MKNSIEQINNDNKELEQDENGNNGDAKIIVDYGNKNLTKNSIISVLEKFATVALGLISSPLILRCLGTEKYGVWASVLGIVSWIYYFDLGIGGGLQNKLTTALSQGRNDDANKYLGTAYAYLSLISAIGFGVGSVFLLIVDIPHLLHYDTIGENVTIVLIVALFFACVNFVAKLVNNVLYATQQAGLVSIFNLLNQVLWVIVLVIYVITGIDALIWIAMAQGAEVLIRNVIATLFVTHKYPQFKGAYKQIKKSYAKDIMSFGVQLFLVNIGALILNTTDNLLISYYFGAVEVTPYHFCYQFFSIIQSVFVAILTPVFSAYTAAYAQKNYNWITKTFRKTMLIWGVFTIGTLVACFVFKPFAAIWLHKELNYQPGLIMLTAAFFIQLMFSHNFSTFINATYQVKKILVPTVVGTIVNIPASILFADTLGLGVNGIMLGSIFAQMFGISACVVVVIRSVQKLKQGKDFD